MTPIPKGWSLRRARLSRAQEAGARRTASERDGTGRLASGSQRAATDLSSQKKEDRSEPAPGPIPSPS